MVRIERALIAADWKVYPGEVPNVVATDTITVGNWVLYRVEVSLEVAPLGRDHVRIFVHPYRKYVGGARRKARYFRGSLQRAILPKLNESFEAEGLTAIGLSG
jgi:hypothetical protein